MGRRFHWGKYFIEARIAGCHIKTGEWDTIRTIGDLRKRCGQVADGRLRWAIDVGAWNPQAEEWDATLLLADPERREKVARYRFVEDQVGEKRLAHFLFLAIFDSRVSL